MRFAVAGFIGCLLFGTAARAHRLDEYLQASLISVERDRVHLELNLTPGVAVLPVVLAAIDTDRDGLVSEAEGKSYASRVLRDLSLSIDEQPLRLNLVSAHFPQMEDLKAGQGVISLQLAADLPASGPSRSLVFENRHQSRISAYLVNSVVPRDPSIQITTQSRDYSQSVYRMQFVEAGARRPMMSLTSWLRASALVIAVFLCMLMRATMLWRHRRLS